MRARRRKDGAVLTYFDLYIGRRWTLGGWNLPESIWFNPFKLPSKATPEQRQACLDMYEAYVRGRPELMAQLPDLSGKIMACFCHPLPCHGDVLVKLWKEHCAPQ